MESERFMLTRENLSGAIPIIISDMVAIRFCIPIAILRSYVVFLSANSGSSGMSVII